ncbi:hypothetical protein BDV93DRAFT_320881 [Ceratobasidium sp. AG-I]|nr:hypothetical protein BDV93DRAFT_320881 [Ceratobasidium sp. AG-I]
MFADYAVSDSTNQTPVTKHIGYFPSLLSTLGLSLRKSAASSLNQSMDLTVTFPGLEEIARGYSSALAKASSMTKGSNGPLDKIGNARVVLKTLLGFGMAVAELHPIAKVVVGLCTKAWEVCVAICLRIFDAEIIF